MTSSPNYEKMLVHLLNNNTIPRAYLVTFEERIVTTCEIQSRGPARAKGHALRHRDYQLKSERRKAQRVYLMVLREAPHAFLPFILVSSPKACTRFDTHKFCQRHRTDERLQLSQGIKTDLENIAIRRNLLQNHHYLELVRLLLPDTSLVVPGQPPKSILPFYFADLLDYLIERQDRQSQLQMTCHFAGAPLSSIELDLGRSSGWNARLELSVAESAGFIAFIRDREVQRESSGGRR